MELHSKDRFKKVPITDIAITKIPFIRYKGLTKRQSELLYDLSQVVLLRAMNENNSNEVAIVHNHPSTQTLSLQDIYLFLTHSTVKVIVVVSNQGTVHYLMKDKNYSFNAARDLYNSCAGELTDESPVRESYNAALDFLTHCTEVGLYYH